jgi:hypothetical protein
MACFDHEDAEVGSAVEYHAPVCGKRIQDVIQFIRGDRKRESGRDRKWIPLSVRSEIDHGEIAALFEDRQELAD